MGTTASVSLNDFSTALQGIYSTGTSGLSEFVSDMINVGTKLASGALTEAQVYRTTADWLTLQYNTAIAASRSAAENSLNAGNSSAASFWKQRADYLENAAAQRAVLGDAAWSKGNAALDLRDSLRGLGGVLAKTAAYADAAIEVAQMIDAFIKGDWDRLGEVSAGLFGSTLFGQVGLLIGAAIVAPVTVWGLLLLEPLPE